MNALAAEPNDLNIFQIRLGLCQTLEMQKKKKTDKELRAKVDGQVLYQQMIDWTIHTYIGRNGGALQEIMIHDPWGYLGGTDSWTYVSIRIWRCHKTATGFQHR